MILENSSTDDGADTQFTIRNNVSGVIYDNHILTQVDDTLSKEDTISITQKPEPIRLLHPPGYDYFNVLRAKLHWGGGQN